MGWYNKEDTITAISTPWGTGAIGVIRVSGPESIPIVSSIFESRHSKDISQKSWGFYSGYIKSSDSTILDDVIVLVMKKPHSYTGEDVVEIHAHGNMLILRSIIELLLSKGARIAEPGEFTKRAFLNGKLDLTQAEAVLDKITAKTRRSLELSNRCMQGQLTKKIHEFADRIKTILAWVEAVIDFPDDELPPELWTQSVMSLDSVIADMVRFSETVERGKLIRDGFTAVLVGKPNVGKSSLFNALLRESRAIVTPYPGTTRDLLQEYMSLSGIPVRLVDTAGLRDSADPIEQEGVSRTWQQIDSAMLVLVVLDATSIDAQDIQIFRQIVQNTSKKMIMVVNKVDLNPKPTLPDEMTQYSTNVVYTCALSMDGLKELEDTIVHCILGSDEYPEDVLLTHEHQKDSLLKAVQYLRNSISSPDLTPELVAFELREALNALGEITGETTPDELLDIIFSSFCIGK